MTQRIDYSAVYNLGAYVRQKVYGWTWRRLFTRLAGNLQVKLRTDKVFSMPQSAAVEVVNFCDSNCALCPVAKGYRDAPARCMTVDEFRRVLDEISPWCRWVGLYNWGEAILHPQIMELIRMCKERRHYVHLSTNSHQLRDDMLEELVLSGLDQLSISLHGASPETYAHYQPGHDFERSIDRIRRLLQIKDRLGRPDFKVKVGFVVMKQNVHEMERLRGICKELGVGYSFLQASLNLRLIDKNRDFSPKGLGSEAIRQEALTLMETWLPEDDRFVNSFYQKVRLDPGILTEQKVMKVMDCIDPWKHIVVRADGEVVPCCGVMEKTHSMGNLFQSSLATIWRGARYSAVRRMAKSPVTEKNATIPCGGCPGSLM